MSALKHVRSEKDPYTLMRMTMVNIFNTLKTLDLAKKMGVKKHFCVSSDKAANPVNMMGASKRIMELFLMRESVERNISTPDLPMLPFLDGSLLHGFNQRFFKGQPFSAPNDVRRYLRHHKRQENLCLLSGLCGQNRISFFQSHGEELQLTTFSATIRYLNAHGYEAIQCSSEGSS